MLNRRNFCALAAGAGLGAAMPRSLWGGFAPAAVIAPGFGRLEQDYAQFCATPQDQRIFYALRGGAIVAEKLEEAGWRPTGWGNPPELPVPGGSWDGVPMEAPISGLAGSGPFEPTWESLLNYECPDWYRDAKFGIWNHWSPQCVPEDGDWYARNMYIEGQPQYEYHLQHYGHPSKFGYKELCAQWTLLNWDPEGLMDLYQRAGARLFIALANHHDGFDAWESRHHEWNASRVGPHKDVIGAWAAAARARGMRFGVTVHQPRNWWWFQPAHSADATGPEAGVAYDGVMTEGEGREQWWEGLDPQQLYGAKHPFDALPDASYVKNFYDRTRDLVDQHAPDLLYFDNALLPLGWAGMNIGAYYYNQNLARNGGRMEGVLNIKNVPPRLAKAVVADIERGLTAGILPHPWQSETCIGQWHYQRRLFTQPGEYGGYLKPREVIHWLVDVVSKNGTFILNIPGKPDGTIDAKERAILERLAAWFAVNGEAVYATRPWRVYGEGPHVIRAGSFQGGRSVRGMGADDIRYTRSKDGKVVYAFFLGWPAREFVAKALGKNGGDAVASVELLGGTSSARWTQGEDALRVELPPNRPANDEAVVLKVRLG